MKRKERKINSGEENSKDVRDGERRADNEDENKRRGKRKGMEQ